MKQTTKITFAAASLAALLAVPAFAAPAQSNAARVGQAWDVVNKLNETGGENSGGPGPVFQAEVDQVLRSGQALNAAPVQDEPSYTAGMYRGQTHLIEQIGETGS